jgi:hypothetical protein
LEESVRTWRLLGLLAISCVAAVTIAAGLPETILAGDAVNYRERMSSLFAGHVPYRDFAFEHQPLMIVPMALAWLAGGFSSQPAYVLATGAISFLCLAGVTGLLVWSERELRLGGWTARWLLVLVPLLPFLLFRNDGFSILLAVAAVALGMKGMETGSLTAAIAGTLSKIWPAVIVPVNWWRGKRAQAVLIVSAAALGLAINFSPSVQAIQQPQGVHTESVAGSVLGLFRSLRGVDLAITRTATAYIDAPRWALGINLATGGIIAVLALRAIRHPFRWEKGWALAGALTVAGVLASPFFSTQYVAWFAPFAAIRRRPATLMLCVSLLSLVVILGWFRLFEGVIWWWTVLLLRNALVVLLGLEMATIAVYEQPSSPALVTSNST